MKINGFVATTSIAAAASSTPRIAETKATQSAFAPNKREALEQRLNRQQEEINRLKKELEAAQDGSGFDDFMAGLFGSDRGASAAEKSTANATATAVGGAAGVAAAIPPVGAAIGASIANVAAAVASAREQQEAKDNSGGFGNLGIFLGPLVGTAIGGAIGGYANDGDETAANAAVEIPKQYASVQLQQGRVALDADWNESESETRKTRKKKPD